MPRFFLFFSLLYFVFLPFLFSFLHQFSRLLFSLPLAPLYLIIIKQCLSRYQPAFRPHPRDGTSFWGICYS